MREGTDGMVFDSPLTQAQQYTVVSVTSLGAALGSV